ncbi:hypothetical protein BX616_010693, partial [Lobosporangium transversale]
MSQQSSPNNQSQQATTNPPPGPNTNPIAGPGIGEGGQHLGISGSSPQDFTMGPNLVDHTSDDDVH